MVGTGLIPAGELDRLVTLQQRTVSRSLQTGEQVESWSELASGVPARIQQSTAAPAPGATTLGAPQDVAAYARPTMVRIRWRASLPSRENLRVVLDTGSVMRVHGIAEYGRRVGFDLACQEWAHE